MKKDDVISYFGSVGNVAKALGISHASVSGWGDVIPKGRAFEIQALTDEELKVNPALYIKPTHSMAKA
ncbi:Cro/CI family transcriptional regulator [Citrobacter freundii complex sp. 2024EL-00238]|uniref:Cro/Cl family transcriptional regulator n=1 Tax=Salmonella enterica TaxID=28901 RepID=A0A756GFA4_SALER|nr:MULTISPECIES: Cro/CI family transcriptional regulator [Citrobacter]EBU8414544.1 hypothetical protein [Salmonella enterica subsp. enterica serovar Typhimurium]HAF9953054.1 hypothetical protein [Salmonella enterica]AYL76007.1 hypothetical protein CUC52_11295 [Citrobacter freundii]EEL7217748.1 hypothetical protein [Salmonella enterica subsp. enterica serovar Typhimurium]MDM3187680.1 Cro/CI family transcriptional regulator [Citrobacter sp. Cf101]